MDNIKAITVQEHIEKNQTSPLHTYQKKAIEHVFKFKFYKTDAMLALAWNDSFADRQFEADGESDPNEYPARHINQKLAAIADNIQESGYSKKEWRARNITEWDIHLMADQLFDI